MGTKLGNSSSSRIHLYVWMFWRHVTVTSVLSVRRKCLTGKVKGLGFYWIRVWGCDLGSNGSSHGQLASTCEPGETFFKKKRVISSIDK